MIRLQEAHLPVVADTHEGMKGKNNEDSFAVSAFQISEKSPIPVLLGVLSDGIGGHRAGEVASSIAVNTVSEYIAKSELNQPVHVLKEAIKHASQEIFAQSQEEDRQGMGATISVVLIVDNRLYTATIGDSRIYLIRAESIVQLSIDHTWIQEALEAGLITAEQAIGHANAHIIRRYLGGPRAPDVDIRLRLSKNESDVESEANQGIALQPGDYVLQCSDGLTDLVKDHEIHDIVSSHPIDEAIHLLIDTANQRGGHDNTTIIITKIPENYQTSPHVLKKTNRSALWLGCIVGLLLAMVALAAVWYFLLRPSWQPQISPENTQVSENIPAATIIPVTQTIEPSPTTIITQTLPDTSLQASAQPALPASGYPEVQHEAAISSLAYSQNGAYLASASIDGFILIWNTKDGSLYTRLRIENSTEGIPAGINSIFWNPLDSKHIASGAADGTVAIWNIDDVSPEITMRSVEASASSITWKSDGAWLAAGYLDGSVSIWDTKTGNQIRSMNGSGDSIRAIAWKPDGEQLAMSYGNGSIKIWDMTLGELLPDMARPSVSANRLTWSSDGQQLVSAYSDGNITIWNLSSAVNSILLPSYHQDAVTALVWRPNSRQFASASVNGEIILWNADNSQITAGMQNPYDDVSALAWHPDGNQLCSASSAGRLIVWDIETRSPAVNSPYLSKNDDSPSD